MAERYWIAVNDRGLWIDQTTWDDLVSSGSDNEFYTVTRAIMRHVEDGGHFSISATNDETKCRFDRIKEMKDFIDGAKQKRDLR
ncbi:hypothetical protein LYZ89_15540 [Xanthomonas hortorum pv. vitians]|uniref:hypothetical protein n=1 Tax=Xanthomonas hortorum TaxID=56454 RepID=UPI00093821FA|nr:hypothetical protein [Xanthomonas hortorum]APP85084.1 hypothetical protein BI317_13865 [Xanthomonas hortorum pv. gardneri]ASW44966.1 hypothetical protein XJ27_02475 [Xanthomonas hortorum]MCE4338457.1 hypothetical protein [Xanthomonas hortorum pv. vitians]NMI39637.1 hypothetical protein [Xanthomonas hortorum pv. vitians]